MSELASLEAQIPGYIRAVEPKAKNGKEVEDLMKRPINVELDKKPKSASETPDVPQLRVSLMSPNLIC